MYHCYPYKTKGNVTICSKIALYDNSLVEFGFRCLGWSMEHPQLLLQTTSMSQNNWPLFSRSRPFSLALNPNCWRGEFTIDHLTFYSLSHPVLCWSSWRRQNLRFITTTRGTSTGAAASSQPSAVRSLHLSRRLCQQGLMKDWALNKKGYRMI